MVFPVVFSSDNNYAPYCGVAISSLIKNASPGNKYEILILYENMSKVNISRLESLSVNYASVKCVNVREWMKGRSIIEHVHLSIAAVYRLFICDIFDEYEKILYLDSDIVVNDDVAKLFSINLEGSVIGAVHGSLGKEGALEVKRYLINTLNIRVENFFNSGILLFNVNAFQRECIGQKCLQLLESRNDLIYMDQCAMNIVCEGKVAYFDRYWNYELVGMEDGTAITEIPPFGICHFDGDVKPWHDVQMFGAEKFWQYARDTIFYEDILYRMNLYMTVVTARFFEILRPYRKIALYGAGYWGRRYVRWIQSTGFHKVTIWVDRAWNDKKNLEMQVNPVESLLMADYDGVLISIGDARIREEICKNLIELGIDKSKLICITY